ncbi:hypothetical protein niasHS_000332 [Heterodera schachtii]|uniref:Uncharacterized protein n=1 Tax=Heterodera schachtii TaxID=97005 RepID=A0ABD2KLN1_HETSC
MSLFRRLAIFIILLAFFPLFCGALKCVKGLIGLQKGYDDKFHHTECANPNHKRCYKIKCSAATNENFLRMDCYPDETNCESYTKSVNEQIGHMASSKWECTCKFGNLFKDNPYPLPASVCKHAFTANKTTFRIKPELVELIKKWGITKEKPDIKCHGDAMVGCQTYRCMDEYENEEFVINGCAEKGQKKCSHGQFDKFCKRKSKKLLPKCYSCNDLDTVCNENSTELITNTYIDCKLSMDYSWLYTPSAELKKWLTKRNMEKNLRTCAMGNYKCQAFTCTDKATGYPLFVFKDCAEPNGKCKTNVLKKFCPPSFESTCYGCEGNKCNKRMPIPDKFTPLQYFAWDNCAPAAANCKPGAAKFSRRFAIGQECEKVYNKKVWNSMGEDKGKSIYDEYENSDKDNANGQVFLADFIRALIEDEKTEEGNEEEDE